ncbi:MAG: enoyl-CoA hydratase-related protein [Deinococcus sp.]|nr:enoyl-CoA hydratase-related protein [Deinococcus sp.]
MSVLLSEQKDQVLTLTLNRPESVNAMTTELLIALDTALEQARDPGIRAVLLRGSGRGFCSGQDLREFSGKSFSYGEHLRRYNSVVERIVSLPKPVVAAVHGAAAGAGMSLALACDFRIVSADAFFTTGFSRIALVPDSGMTFTLPSMVGRAKAFELMATSERLTPEQALSLGIVNRVVPAEAFEQEAANYAQALAQGPTMTLGFIKQALYRGAHSSLGEMLALEAELQELAGATLDHQEGVKAFWEKRAPKFQGK